MAKKVREKRKMGEKPKAGLEVEWKRKNKEGRCWINVRKAVQPRLDERWGRGKYM